ncbi:MAG: hypothetical protein J5506_07830 [Prevotella sp.]|nr:hypothetical protein [Prevotella sp.]
MAFDSWMKRFFVALVLCCLFGRVAAWCNDVNPLARMASTVYAKEVTYDSSGNILSKTGTGSYDYDGPRPHAVTETDMLGSADSIGVAYTYNTLGKIGRMEKGVPRDSTIATFEYGPDGERWKCTVTNIHYFLGQRRTDVCRSTYAGDYEEIYHSLLTDYPGTAKHYNLGHGVIYWKHLSQPTLPQQPQTVKTRVLYACTDNLGSIMRLVDGQGNVVFKATYDAWGNQTIQTDSLGYRRGFTGHEHIPEFGLINMNGRLYDPATAAFLSPDNYVQLPFNSQSFNRYSYCLNNPLKYTDPSGELFGIDDAFLAFALINMTSSMVQAAYNGGSVWKAGALSLLSSFGSYGIGELFGHSAGSIGNELLRAGAHGLADGTISALSGGSFGSGFLSGALSSGIGSLAQGVNMNPSLMVATTTAMGGLGAWITGGDMFSGAMQGFMIGATNHGLHELGGPTEEEIKAIYDSYISTKEKYPDVCSFFTFLGGDIAVDSSEHPEWYRNTCAARLSHALNESGVMKIPFIKGQTFKGADNKYYFMKASVMKRWLKNKLWGIPKYISYKPGKVLPSSIVFQTGFSPPVTGHVDVVFRGLDSGSGAVKYYRLNGIKTYLWNRR